MVEAALFRELKTIRGQNPEKQSDAGVLGQRKPFPNSFNRVPFSQSLNLSRLPPGLET